MFRNYLKIATRNLLRNKVFSAINIIGLALGIATCLIIMLFIYEELSYDRYNDKADRIVRVVFKASINDGKINEANVMPPTGQTLKNEFPEVLEVTRLYIKGLPAITYQEKKFKENLFASVDPNFFQVFTLRFIKGDVKTALKEPNTVVVTKAFAKKYFGDADPIGKVISINEWNQSYKITGLIDKVPKTSHFHFDIFGSNVGLKDAQDPSWLTSGYFTYLVLPIGYNYKKLESKLPQIIEKYMGPQIKIAMGMELSQFLKKGNNLGLFLQPLIDIHLNSDFTGNIESGGNIQYVYIFIMIAIFMLLIACINFMNLSTAGSSKRAKEVGVRKVLGSVKIELIKQFLFESIFLVFFSLILSLLFVQLALPIFNNLAEKDLQLNMLFEPRLFISFLFFGLVVGGLAGSYPAFFLSSFKPIDVLKGKFKVASKNLNLRSVLVVFQFSISILLIIGTAVVLKQINYIKNKDLGYNRDQLIILRQTGMLGEKEQVFREQILQDPRVLSVSTASFIPAGPTNSNNSLVYADGNKNEVTRTLQYEIDENYIPTMGMKILTGRNFSKDFSTDSTSVIINEAAAEVFGWGKNAIGHSLTRKNNDGHDLTYKIIGIVKNFHFKPLHERVTPLLMVSKKSFGLTVKVKTTDVKGLINSLEKKWLILNKEEPFTYSFMDELFEQTYKSEQKIGIILGIFSAITIFVACLGLFGLTTFTAEQRIKEIGIRKVLGASVNQIVTLLTKDFLKLVIISFLIAVPFSWYIMNKWLQNFAYRIEISWWMFAIAGILSLLIALLTVSFQAIKAAIANPVKSLRSE